MGLCLYKCCWAVCRLAQTRWNLFYCFSAEKVFKEKHFSLFPQRFREKLPSYGMREVSVCSREPLLCAPKQGRAVCPGAGSNPWWPSGRGEAPRFWPWGVISFQGLPGCAGGLSTAFSWECNWEYHGIHGCYMHLIAGLLFLPVKLLEGSWYSDCYAFFCV